ncbi:hypothetical protein RhiirA4_459026 [Rhizophagus irregularis]|uniref:Uncharacterized protein n=1 Tax=Rhizophagus irregularis TaxID=588596 RepID=A0A2I1GDG1_9GLOM|nr:hypothetical protein RhiirA4_459026 [Rhizophagus irregularis]
MPMKNPRKRHIDQKGIRCNGAPKLNLHKYVLFPNNVDLELLETMFNERSYYPNGINFELQKDESDVIDECYMVCPNNTRFNECCK